VCIPFFKGVGCLEDRGLGMDKKRGDEETRRRVIWKRVTRRRVTRRKGEKEKGDKEILKTRIAAYLNFLLQFSINYFLLPFSINYFPLTIFH
jgi:hypothetical protein